MNDEPTMRGRTVSPALPAANPWVAAGEEYRVPRHPAPVDLCLDGTAGAPPDGAYPDPGPLQGELAVRLGVGPEQVLVTAGADEALDRICRAFLGPDRELVLPTPTFEMLPRYAAMAGATVREVAWPGGDFPLDAVQDQVSQRTGVIAIISPNNPTGAVATAAQVRALAERNPTALILLDLAYVEFADQDPTAAVLASPNVVVTRTFSKAWGLAALRVGYAVGGPAVVASLRRAGGPYAVAGPSLARVRRALSAGFEQRSASIAAVRRERDALRSLLARFGVRTLPSQANFVLLQGEGVDASFLRDALAGLGIAVRVFPNRQGLGDAVRITCPGDDEVFARLCAALCTVFGPQALLLDMDGVLADVSGSYRQAIEATARSFGVDVSQADVQRVKALGNANNDWEVTWRLVVGGGVEARLDEVTARFETCYQGTKDTPGLWANERLLPDRDTLVALARKLPLAVVTGRPRQDAERFLKMQEIEGLIRPAVCMEDAPPKPDPAPVNLALARLGIERAWMVGDTPDDIRSARAAAVLPLGIVPPGQDRAAVERSLLDAGAGRLLGDLTDILELLS